MTSSFFNTKMQATPIEVQVEVLKTGSPGYGNIQRAHLLRFQPAATAA